jgi:hypothetical protein
MDQAYQTAEISGVITKVDFPKNKGDPTTFRINFPNSKQTFDGVCSLYCPMRVGDTIYGLAMIGPDNKLHITRSPFVQPAMDKDSVISCLMRATKKGYKDVIKIYSTLERLSDGEDKVIPFLTAISQSWNDTRNVDLLLMIDGQEMEVTKKLLQWWHKERNLRRLFLFGLIKEEINACRLTCDEIYQGIMKNPYTLPAIPIEKCDSILDRMNITPNNTDRLRGAIIRVIWNNLHKRSWMGTPTKVLAKQFPDIRSHVDILKEDYGLVCELETAYLKYQYKVETWLTDWFVKMKQQDKINYDTPLDTKIMLENGEFVERLSAHVTKETLSEDQMMAIHGALDHSVSIVTGPPGTGKSTILGEIIHNLELRGTSYAVCSFTGKAVSRIREITKKKNPSTMHRLIANTKKNILDKPSKQYEKELFSSNYEHILIDEFSMVSADLLYDFLQAYPDVKKVTFLGDINQLPPIGWGSVMRELMKSETIPTYTLTTNFRTYTVDGERDGIILNSNLLTEHDPQYPFEFVKTSNFNIIEGPEERIFDILRGCYKSGVKAEDICIITPFNRCLPFLNKKFQDIFNEGKKSVTDARGIKWMVGDKVMLTQNDPDINTFNGEQGIVRDVDDKNILVDFGTSGQHEFLLESTPGRYNYEQGTTRSYYKNNKVAEEVMYGDEGEYMEDERTVKKLIHAYAITVDKSQGSEYNFVIGYIPEFNTGSFLNKNRILTLISRTKRCCWMVVSDEELFNMSAVKPSPYRCENLAKRLKSRLPNVKPYVKKRDDARSMPFNISNEEVSEIPSEEMDAGFDCDDF